MLLVIGVTSVKVCLPVSKCTGTKFCLLIEDDFSTEQNCDKLFQFLFQSI